MIQAKINGTTVESSGEMSHKKFRASSWEKAFSQVLSIDVSIVEPMKVPAFKSGVPEGCGINMKLSDGIDDLIRSGFEFSLGEFAHYFGNSTGSANVTSVVAGNNLPVIDVLRMLADSGELRQAANDIEQRRKQSDPPAVDILAYALWKYSLGWDAERILAEQTEFTKGSVAHDQGGVDGFLWGEPIQVKPITELGSKGPSHFEDKSNMYGEQEIKHLFYMYDHQGGLRAVMFDGKGGEYLKMKSEVAEELGVMSTPLWKTTKPASTDLGRFRLTWV